MSERMVELNNNDSNASDVNFPVRRVSSASSGSSCNSDSGDDCSKLSRRSSDADLKPEESRNLENEYRRKGRSMSDGGTRDPKSSPSNDDSFQVFPSLPDVVLEKMGLLGDSARDRLNDEELEQKFISLSLAFTIDATTIKDRCSRQRRYRDQTETNLQVEIERLIQRSNRIQPLCVDSETTELLSSLLTQIEVVYRAAALASLTAERYGAVQHELRLSDSVRLMIGHVNQLKQQRDNARRQLQYTKRVLQDTNATENIAAKSFKPPSPTNRHQLTRRRASIATFSQPQESIKNELARKTPRRVSDLSLRATSLSRSSRPSRLELGVELVKIKEGSIELDNVPSEEVPEENENSLHTDDEINKLNDEHEDTSTLSIRQKIVRHISHFPSKVKKKYEKWTEDGTLHEIFCFCALLCFSFSLMTMANILVEYELAKRGLNNAKFSWFSNNYYQDHGQRMFGEKQPT